MSGWQAILSGADAQRARSVIAAVVDELEPDPSGGLENGHAALALVRAYMAKGGNDQAHEQCIDALEIALEQVENLKTPWLIDGITGLAWATAHLGDLVEIDDETGEVFDELILRLVGKASWDHEWEHLYGLIGLGIYSLERSTKAAALIRGHILRHLEILSVEQDGTLSWLSPPAGLVLSSEERAANPDGHYNLGIAHGVAGIVAWLAQLSGSAIRDELLEGAVQWLQAHDLRQASGRFPNRIGNAIDGHAGAVSGWCYGDQALGLTLISAGRACDREDWIDYGAQVARSVIGRPTPDGLAPSFCHGHLGRAHMFNRIGQTIADRDLLDAARTCYRRALDLFEVPGRLEGMGPGILEGRSGIALTLLAGVSTVAPDWDRAFLCAPAPISASDGASE